MGAIGLLVDGRRGGARLRHLAREDGLTAVEYGLIVALIGLVFVLAGPALGDALAGLRHTVTGGVAS
jgi:Flp pilus assembly pilin Flp